MSFIDNFEVWPKIVLADKYSNIFIKDKYNQGFIKDSKEFDIYYYPLERYSPLGEYRYAEKRTIKANNNILSINQFFKSEQEHIIEIREKDSNHSFLKVNVYSLHKDLFDLRPYKGDLHMHSYYSDGQESPEFVAASCRKIGLDFMAITDHGLYAPSVQAQNYFKDLDLDFLICLGEEVHPENNPVHIINFGGNFSINEEMINNKEKYYEEVNKIKERLPEIHDEDAKYQCASCLWVFDKIRKANGLGIFCHPYWLVNEGYYISDTVISYMLENQPYDALELIGGYYKSEANSNILQVARYYEERSKGKSIPIVGVSDSHGCQNGNLFGWYYTIVFSQNLQQESIINNIKNLNSVAVEALPGETVRVYGPFRLVKYSLFLLREILPKHDKLCSNEGKLMLDYLSGDKKSLERLKNSKGQIERLYCNLWAKSE
ncbi:PHP domain-containing protein [Caldicellulosiruptoraceae bacterium PP1]